MRLTTHLRMLTIAVATWAAFLLAGLPDYYQQYSRAGMLVFSVVLIPPIVLLAFKVIGRSPLERRIRLATWIAFYFSLPLMFLDYAYCGVYLGYGLGFLTRYWYLTVYYFVPWLILVPIGYRLSVADTDGVQTSSPNQRVQQTRRLTRYPQQ